MAGRDIANTSAGVPVGICGGYQMLGDTIVDEVESGLGTRSGLGRLNTILALHGIKPRLAPRLTRQCRRAARLAGCPRRGYRYAVMKFTWGNDCCPGGCLYAAMTLQKNGCSIWADGAVTADGLAFNAMALFGNDTLPCGGQWVYRRGVCAVGKHFVIRMRAAKCWREACGSNNDIDKIYSVVQQHQNLVPVILVRRAGRSSG